MPGIFVSHASDDKQLVDAFVDIVLRLGCNVPSEAIFYSSGADTGVPSGSDLNAYVRNRIGDMDLVVAVITLTFQARPFCVAELGAAWSRVGNLFPVKHPELGRAEMEGVLTGMVVRSFDEGEALDELHDRVRETTGHTTSAQTWGHCKEKWLEGLPTLLDAVLQRPPARVSKPQGRVPKAPAVGSGSNRRRELLDSVVNAAVYIADDTIGREEILRAAEYGMVVPARYLYSSDLGADNWIRLCHDPMYRHYRETMKFWRGRAGREMALLISSTMEIHKFGYVSLGSGDGEKDATLISHWLSSGADLFYYPYDISVPLVSKTVRAVREQARRNSIERLRMQAVIADFSYLDSVSKVFTDSASPNVYALLGNSLGNIADEIGFLRRLKEQMSNEDLLLLEVRLKSGEMRVNSEKRVKEVMSVPAMRFDFGSVEHYLGLSFSPDRMTARHETDLSSIQSTVTTVVACKHESYGEIKLSYIHEYEERNMLDALTSVGFQMVASRSEDGEGSLVCVARKMRTAV